MTASDRKGPSGAYLRPSVKIEPLVCRWYAWPHLIAPAQHAMNLAYRQLPLMESFVSTPSIHVASSRDPSLYGGPFVDLPTTEVANVVDLLATTRKGCDDLIALARAIRDLDELLKGATGASLDPCYAAMPEILRGLVELSYDLAHRPVFRFREALLYEAFQSGRRHQDLLLHETGDAERQFFLNTPRLNMPAGSVLLQKPFSDPAVDLLAKSRYVATDVDDLARTVGLSGADLHAFAALFTDGAPQRRGAEYAGPDVRVRYFGHACVLVQTAEVAVLIDPSFASERDVDSTLTMMDLPDRIDYVVLSHTHQDHFVLESLLQLRRRIGQVVVAANNVGSLSDPSAKLILRSVGIENVTVLDELERLPIAGGELLSLPFPGEHCDVDVHTRQCLALTIKGRRLLFLVDSDAVDPALYRLLSKSISDVDLLFIGMECFGAPLTWLYGPLLLRPISRSADNSRRGSGSTSDRAWGVVEAIGCSRVFVYAMGMEAWNRHLLGLAYTDESLQITESNAFVARCRAAGIEAERLQGCRELILPAGALQSGSPAAVARAPVRA